MPSAFRGKAVSIVCTDLDRSEQFYEKILGAERIPGDGNGCPWFRLGLLTITLVPNAATPSLSTFPENGMSTLWLEVDDIDKAHAHLVAQQVQILEYDDEQWLMCTDPDGIIIEVWQAESA